MNRSLFLACVGISLACRTANAAGICGQLEPPKVDENSLTGAVLRLQGADPEDSGTGYLISTTQGYVLTAEHVVKQPMPGGIIQATSPWRPGVVFEAQVIGELTGSGDPVDMALLKIKDPTKLSGIRPIDVSLKLPDRGAQLHTMGYPQFGDQPNNTLQTTPLGNPSFVPHSGDIQTNDAIAKPGASGSPLLNEFGATVGTATAGLGVQQVDAWFIPTVSATPLLDMIPPSDEAIKIESTLKSNSVDQASLQAMLANTNEVSNLDLYELIGLINRDRDANVISRDLLRCPISYALDERGLFDLVIDMREADIGVKSNANLQIAQRDVVLGNSVLAVTHSQRAIEGYRSLSDSESVLKSQLILAQAQYQSDTLPQAKETLAAVLAGVNTLPMSDRGDAYLLAGEIDTKTGDPTSARGHFQKASENFASQNQFDRAALAKRLTASIDLRQGAMQAAEVSSNDAIQFYKASGNIQGQADLLYEKAKIQAISGDKNGLKGTAAEYIKLSPNGMNAVELKKVLNEDKLPAGALKAGGTQ